MHTQRWQNQADVIWRSLEKRKLPLVLLMEKCPDKRYWAVVSVLGQDPPGEPGASSPPTSQGERGGNPSCSDRAVLCPTLTCFLQRPGLSEPQGISAPLECPAGEHVEEGTRNHGVLGLSRCPQHTSGVLSCACDAPLHWGNGWS